MTDEWDDYAALWDEDLRVQDYANQAFSSLISLADIRDGWKERRVLDFGCGTGLLSQRIAPHVCEVVAVDTSTKMVEALAAKSLDRVTALTGDIADANLRARAGWDDGFDLVVASSVCAFLDDYSAAVRQLAGGLKAGGRIVQWDWLAQEGGGFGMTEEQIAQVLAEAGLTHIRIDLPFVIGEGKEAMQVIMGSGTKA